MKTGNYTTRRKTRIVVETVVNSHTPVFDQDEIKRHIERVIGNALIADPIAVAGAVEVAILWGEIIR